MKDNPGFFTGRTPLSAQQAYTERTQLREQYNQLPIVIWGNLITAGITALFYYELASHVFLTIWLCLLLITLSVRYVLFLAFKKNDSDDLANWVWAYALGAAATGTLWAMLSIYLIQAVEPESLLIIFLALLGLTGGNIATASYRKRMFVAFSTPALVPAGLVALFSDSRMVVMMGAFSLALYILTLIAVNRLSKSLTSVIRLDQENRELIKALKHEKSQMEKTNQRLNQELQRKLSMTKWLAAGVEAPPPAIRANVGNGNFGDFLADIWEQSIESQHSLSLVTFELDGDYEWPDNDGELSEPFRKIQDEICSAIRSNDVFVRINSKEMAIILSQLSARDAVSLVNRLRGKLVSKVGLNDNNLPITISWGVAGWTPDVTQDASELITASRHAKNMSKNRGGNQVSLC
jgi:diguanylate cyclase (GGDEF)-like protein